MSTAADFDRMVMEFMRDDPLTAYIVKQSTTGTFDPTTGNLPTSEIEIPVQAIQLDLTLRTNGDGAVPYSLIRASDKLLFVRPPEKTDIFSMPLVINPAIDGVRIGTKVYTIVMLKEVNPSGSNVILYELYIRK